MPVDDVPPALDFDDSDADSVSSQHKLEQFMKEKINAPTFPLTGDIWAKASTNRLALNGKAGTELVETHPLSYDFDQATGFAHATDLVKLNYYSPLWLDDPDTDHSKWHYDLELRHAENAEACVESTPLRPNHENYQHLIQPATAVYDVERLRPSVFGQARGYSRFLLPSRYFFITSIAAYGILGLYCAFWKHQVEENRS
ncbi:unnamed protein product [Peronospora effusa]|nr:unnamed protein product [Peronospora effusa]